MSSRSITPVRRLSPVPRRDADELVNTPASGGFVSFEYSYTEVSSHAGRTHVRSNKTQFAHGKLTRETFERELEGDAYEAIRALLTAPSYCRNEKFERVRPAAAETRFQLNGRTTGVQRLGGPSRTRGGLLGRTRFVDEDDRSPFGGTLFLSDAISRGGSR